MADVEGELLAAINFATSEVPCANTLSGRHLQGLDEIISFLEAIGPYTDFGLYDDAWNLRNHLVPFKPGDKHYDPECGQEDDEPPTPAPVRGE